MKRKIIIISALVLAAIITAFFMLKPSTISPDQIDIETGIVKRGTISSTVTATGTLEAITSVDVGTQVSGIIENIYVDFNSTVKEGQLLARIDTTNLAAAVEQSQASLDNAKAQMDFQQANYNRLKPLFEKELIAQSEYDETVYNFNVAKANYKSALAQHRQNLINLDFAMIYSPINGVVLNKAVEEGQTVAASFETPTLFTIVKDLTQMQVEANVDEADIGQVKKGQRVEFTVDAYPNEIFEGEVTEVRLEPTVTNNVVTYTIIIIAPNPDYKLMPGLTAETNIFVVEKKDILTVPSKAARFEPDQQLMMSYMQNTPQPPMPQDAPTEGMPPMDGEGQNQDMIWVKRDSMIQPVPVKLGMDDDINAEVLDGLKEGDMVVLKMEQKNAQEQAPEAAGGNPFMPKPPQRNKK
ncbi:efflux RND transporter periplasmic adaptor subunit [Carboxylicivirga linearis]|uniref:Efflux RND transporter periplasmic adaptor subunit n=1 Tax=Carboxylicivirga linearis TaxID=1628157 RepID=A0ABS5JY46_9BACT|nr:efflux RND transporter periplasmic adaptor subunit [Carboxylicivirga linearis]MBS2099803.1 efflux RND transporter periplasmic adaptor subunit [Carboxylicivirga linearis]